MLATRLVGGMFGLFCVVSVAMAADADSTRKVFTPDSSSASGSSSSGVYIGAGLGQSQTGLSAALSKDTDVAYNVFLGYQFNRNLAAEIAYVNLGKVTMGTGTGAISGKSSGGSVTAMGALDLSDSVSLYGKFGLAKMSTTWDSAPATGVATDQSKTGLTWGAGLNFDISPRAAGRLSFDRYSIGEKDPVTGHAQMVALSVLLKF